ncbi:hypothetical protein HaLaN_17564 [Haematococcus lacustris]|uniref:Uncharacterized protein n=1 Tax=Haematococcus lacustris TaxID=44745 RepID=A0A699ZGY0_HAELA|nr:hypothetical protein HaLaN_17564 [Haematococcus lacustris]
MALKIFAGQPGTRPVSTGRWVVLKPPCPLLLHTWQGCFLAAASAGMPCLTTLAMQAQISHHRRIIHIGYFPHEELAAKLAHCCTRLACPMTAHVDKGCGAACEMQVRDLMAIKLRGMHTPLNFVSETYKDMYELLARVDQIKTLLAESGRQQGSIIREAALATPDPDVRPDLSNASSPTATTLPRQSRQPLAPSSAAGRAKAKCSIEALGWTCDAAGAEAAASLPPGKRPKCSAMAVIDSGSLGNNVQGTSTGRCPSAAAACADTTASKTRHALGLTLLAASQLVGASVVGLAVGWAEADALWEQAEQVHEEGGGGDVRPCCPAATTTQLRKIPTPRRTNSNAQYADSSKWGARRVGADVAGHAQSGQYTRATEQEEAGEGQLAMEPASWSPSTQATRQPAASSYRQRLQLLLCQQRCAAPSECTASAAASWDG